MIDIQMLRCMRVRSDYNRIASAVTASALDMKTRAMMDAIGRYYKKFPTHNQIEFTTFTPFVFNTALGTVHPDDKVVYTNMIKAMASKYPDEATRHGIFESIHDLNLVHKVSAMVERYNNGDDLQIVSELAHAVDTYKTALGVTSMPEVAENIDELLENLDNDVGVHWRLPCLNKAMRPLRGGDFGIIAARPDQGKTSFLSSELTYMAPQLPTGRPILWLNNEGPGFRIRPRLMQAALDCTESQLVAFKNDNELYPKYWETMGGRDRIRVMDIHGYSNGQVEQLIEQTTPGLVVFDMIDNVRGFGDSARNDIQLERMYQWAREMAVKHDFIGLATSQISAEGENEQWPQQSFLKDSKTGKQGACEFIMMIGSIEKEASYANTRWISLPKNKLRKSTSGGALKETLRFDRDRARFHEVVV